LGGAQGGGGEGPPGLRVLRVRLAGSGCAWSAGIHADALDDTFFSLSTRYKDQQVTHTHTHRQRTNIPRHRHTRTRQEQHPKPPNEHLPQTLNNARRWRERTSWGCKKRNRSHTQTHGVLGSTQMRSTTHSSRSRPVEDELGSTWPLQDIILLLIVCARVNRPFILPARLHCPHCCNTLARLLGNIRPPSTSLWYAIHHTTLVITIALGLTPCCDPRRCARRHILLALDQVRTRV